MGELHLGATVRLCGAATAAEFAAFGPPGRAFAAQRAVVGEAPHYQRQRWLLLVHNKSDKILMWALWLIYLFCIVVPFCLFVMISKV